MCRAFKESSLEPGGVAVFVRVPPPNVRHATFRVPDHLTDEEASFVEPLACCLRAVERARVQPGDTALVVGLGSIGCLLVQLFARAGSAVVGADQDAEAPGQGCALRSEEHTSELQSPCNIVCRLLLEKKKIGMNGLLGVKFLHPSTGIVGCCLTKEEATLSGISPGRRLALTNVGTPIRVYVHHRQHTT